MASRENQSLQISLMVSAILVVLLAVLTYWFYSNWDKANADYEASKSQLSDVRNNHRALVEDTSKLKTIMGFKEEDNVATIEESFQNELKNVAATQEEAGQSYRSALSAILKHSEDLTTRETNAKVQLKKLKEEYAALEKLKDMQISQHSKESKQAKADLKEERNTFNKERDKFKNSLGELTSARDNALEELADGTNKSEGQVATTNKELQFAQRQIKKLQAIIDGTSPEATFEKPDGSVTWINHRARTVWISLGSADAIRTGINFSIYSNGQDINKDVEPKARIEVIQVLKDHLSEARILSDSITDPILPRDPIFSTSWQRGSRIHFALAGVIDLDGDGRNDIERAMDIIRINGGIIDEYVSKDGKRIKTGEGMTIDTKYLIEGRTPDPNEKQSRAIHDSTGNMLDDADKLGVRKINLQSFLDLMGWEADERTIPLGSKARADDFPAKLPGGVQRLDPARPEIPYDGFKKRHPRTPY